MKKAVPFTFYFIIFAGSAAFRPYLALYYQSLSFSGAEIGLLVGIPPLIMIFMLPFITGIADASNRHRLVMNILLVVVTAGLFLMPYLSGFIPILMVITLVLVLFAPIMPITNNAAMFMLGTRRDLFGRVRLGGTLGFAVASFIIGALIEDSGLQYAFWFAAGLYGLAFIVAQSLKHSDHIERKKPDWSQASQLVKNPHFALFLLIGLTGGISFTTIGTYLFPYMKELGARESVMGIALTIGTISEIPLLFFANRLVTRFGTYAMLVFSMLLTALRFVLLAIAPSATVVLFIQLLNGFNYPLLIVAGVTYADEQAPDGFKATAQGLFDVMIVGVGSAIGGFIGGILFDAIGARGMYLFFAILVTVVVGIATLIRRTLPPEVPMTIATESV